jgi:subtilisin-like proprotein convertase family protein
MDQDRDGIQGEAADDQYSSTASIRKVLEYSWEGRKALRDRRATTVKFRVADDVTIDDIDVRVDLDHTWDSDLQLILISPDRTKVRLFNRSGGSGDDIMATFDDEATTAIADGSAPFDGDFIPDRSLSKFDGESTKGTWKLRIRDRAAGDVGTIYGVTIIVTPDSSSTSSSTSISPTFSSDQQLVGASFDLLPRVVEAAVTARNRLLSEVTDNPVTSSSRADLRWVAAEEVRQRVSGDQAVDRRDATRAQVWSSYQAETDDALSDAWDDTLALLTELAS